VVEKTLLPFSGCLKKAAAGENIFVD
jgi:hypothetical protein